MFEWKARLTRERFCLFCHMSHVTLHKIHACDVSTLTMVACDISHCCNGASLGPGGISAVLLLVLLVVLVVLVVLVLVLLLLLLLLQLTLLLQLLMLLFLIVFLECLLSFCFFFQHNSKKN